MLLALALWEKKTNIRKSSSYKWLLANSNSHWRECYLNYLVGKQILPERGIAFIFKGILVRTALLKSYS